MTLDVPRLWQAVILRALQDAIWIEPPRGKRYSGRNDRVGFFGTITARTTACRLRDEAIFWLTTDSKNFTTICDLAGVPAWRVRKAAHRLLGASNEQKALWASNGFSVLDLRGLRELRDGRVDAEKDGNVVLPGPLPDDAGRTGVKGKVSEATE